MQPRVYYFDRHRENVFDSQALAYGGGLVYGSGWWRDRVKLNASLYTTQKAYGPDDKDGTLLLKPGQEGFWVLGEANVELKLGQDTVATDRKLSKVARGLDVSMGSRGCPAPAVPAITHSNSKPGNLINTC